MSRRKRDYRAEYARRIARGKARGLSRSQARGHPKASEQRVSKRTPAPLDGHRLQVALKELRRGRGLTATARSIGVSPERLRHHVSSKNLAEKHKGRWVTREGLPRRMRIYSRGRDPVITLGDFKTASQVGRFMAAVGRFLRSNDISHLNAFVGRSVTDIAGKNRPFETRPNVLYQLASSGTEPFEEVYRIIV